MKDLHITIYTRDNCPNCVTAKRILEAAGLIVDRLGGSEKVDTGPARVVRPAVGEDPTQH